MLHTTCYKSLCFFNILASTLTLYIWCIKYMYYCDGFCMTSDMYMNVSICSIHYTLEYILLPYILLLHVVYCISTLYIHICYL